MQRIKRWYLPTVNTLAFLSVATIAAVFLFSWLGWSPQAPFDANHMVELELLSPMEAVVATGVGPDPATVTLAPGIWVVELTITTEDYEGITLQSDGPGGSATQYWPGERRAIVVTGADRMHGALLPGETRVRTGALPGHAWTVTFTRHDVR